MQFTASDSQHPQRIAHLDIFSGGLAAIQRGSKVVEDNARPGYGLTNRRDHIVILDDNLTLLRLMQSLLTDEGYAVETIPATTNAHQRIKELKPSLLILDMVLETPDSGWQFLEALKLDPETRNIPVIVCSAAANLLLRQRELFDQHNCYILPKPFDMDELLHLTQFAIEESRARH